MPWWAGDNTWQIVLEKKKARHAAGLCVNCGRKPCQCKVGKNVKIKGLNGYTKVLPVGVTRRGGQRP